MASILKCDCDSCWKGRALKGDSCRKTFDSCHFDISMNRVVNAGEFVTQFLADYDFHEVLIESWI